MATVIQKVVSHGVDVEKKHDSGPIAAICNNPGSPSPRRIDLGEVEGLGTHTEPAPASKKPISFYLAFLSLLMMVLIVSLDATILAVALPVGSVQLEGTFCI